MDLPEYWNEKARDVLLKRKIVDVEYMGVKKLKIMIGILDLYV